MRLKAVQMLAACGGSAVQSAGCCISALFIWIYSTVRKPAFTNWKQCDTALFYEGMRVFQLIWRLFGKIHLTCLQELTAGGVYVGALWRYFWYGIWGKDTFCNSTGLLSILHSLLFSVAQRVGLDGLVEKMLFGEVCVLREESSKGIQMYLSISCTPKGPFRGLTSTSIPLQSS